MSSARNPGVETLRSDPAYNLVRELDFQDMIPFVLTNINTGILDQSLTWRGIIGQSLIGIICGSILVIPLHELVHGVAYRLLGAKSIRFGADFQQFIFYVTADRYPVSGRQLYFLALAPFVIINLVAIAITLLFFQQAILFSGFFLLSHNIMCIGDFAIANFVRRAKSRLYSFDEPEKKKSYFFEEVTGEG
jgi:hypothetical protein